MKVIKHKHAKKTETEVQVFASFLLRASVKINLVGAVWQTGRIICHRNTVELVQVNPLPSGRTFGFGMGAGILNLGSARIFRDVIVQRNFCRPADGATDPDTSAVAANWTENGIVQRNVCSGLNPDPFGYYKIASLHQFNNQTHAGQIVQGTLYFFDTGAPSVHLNQLETELDLGLTAAGNSADD